MPFWHDTRCWGQNGIRVQSDLQYEGALARDPVTRETMPLRRKLAGSNAFVLPLAAHSAAIKSSCVTKHYPHQMTKAEASSCATFQSNLLVAMPRAAQLTERKAWQQKRSIRIERRRQFPESVRSANMFSPSRSSQTQTQDLMTTVATPLFAFERS
jgi:hypothetical protein